MYATPAPPTRGDAASLEPIETSGFGGAPLSLTFRHSGWTTQRAAVWAALLRTSATTARLLAFQGCGSHSFILKSPTDPPEYKLAGSYCHDRFCRPCANSRSFVIATNIRDYLGKKATRFITLTLKHNALPLAQQIKRLYDSFRKLRKTSLWKRTQTGGVAFLEITKARALDEWHPHFHILSQGKFLPHAELRNLWFAITGDSHIVDVRAVADVNTVTNYVTKYATKPFDPSLFESEADLEGAILALKGRRMILTFGNWKGLQTVKNKSEVEWLNLGRFDDFLAKAALGDAEAEAIARYILGGEADRYLAEAAKRDRLQPRLRSPPTDQAPFLFAARTSSPY